MAFSRPAPLREELARALPDRPFEVAFWDGSTLPATNGTSLTTFRVKSPLALAHALRAPGQLGIGRAYVSGALDVDDIDAAIDVLDQWKPPALDTKAKLKLAAAALKSTGLIAPPKPPQAELIPQGRRHSIERDKAAVRHHYDVSNEYFATFLDPTMTYSCAIFSRGAKTLEEAQWVKRELVCTKLGLQAGERVLDVGCGWGAFAIHAAKEHGVHVTGITLSEPQAELARQRAAGGRRRRPGRHQGDGLARAAGRAVRRDLLDRHGRARRLGQHRQLRASRCATSSSRAAACSTTASAACAGTTRRPGRSPSATCSPTARRCTCRGS